MSGRGDLLDLILLGACLLFGISGYRQGFVVGVLSFVGFLGGGVLGAKVAPSLAHSAIFTGLPTTTVAVSVVFFAAVIGQLVATVAGGWVRKHLVWHPIRVVDAVAGAGV